MLLEESEIRNQPQTEVVVIPAELLVPDPFPQTLDQLRGLECIWDLDMPITPVVEALLASKEEEATEVLFSIGSSSS